MIDVREKVDQMFKGKLFLVVLVLGLLTIAAAAGVVTAQRGKGNGTNPYLRVPQPEMIAQEITPEMPQVAGASDAAKETQKSEPAPTKVAVARNANQGNSLVAEAGAGKNAADVLVPNPTDAGRIEWPIKGGVLLGYSMDQTICFPTLSQYKCNPGLVVQSDVSVLVGAPANARMPEVGSNEEIRNYAVTDPGNEYTATYGQLKEVYAAEDKYLKRRQALGYVSESTKYYSAGGISVFFELKHQDKTVGPLDYME